MNSNSLDIAMTLTNEGTDKPEVVQKESERITQNTSRNSRLGDKKASAPIRDDNIHIEEELDQIDVFARGGRY